MRAGKANCPAGMMARILEASRPGFHGWLAKGAPEDGRGDVRDAVHRAWAESDRRFGARSIRRLLPGKSAHVTLHRVRKCMRELGDTWLCTVCFQENDHPR